MKGEAPVITHFHSLRPAFETAQEELFDWLIHSHTHAESLQSRFSDLEKEAFYQQLKKKLYHVGCKSPSIIKRGHEIPDFQHTNWDLMEIYRLNDIKEGSGLKTRHKIHQKHVLNRFEEYYPKESKAPDHLLHVTCTGYTSPNAPQILASKRGWEKTVLTHCYHLGCYGSIPALRLASAFLQKDQRIDIVHTELCTLHFNPLNHDLDQLVGQSLFADGYIKYSVMTESEARKTKRPGLKIAATHEMIIPDSSSSMEWLIKDWGFHFKLSKEIPTLIAAHLKKYLTQLCEKSGHKEEEILSNAIFAIHPGGPKIIDNIKTLLNLTEEQVTASRDILSRYGNMSSATLPHIWEVICNDPTLPDQTPVISLAFGPGLTLAGSLLIFSR